MSDDAMHARMHEAIHRLPEGRVLSVTEDRFNEDFDAATAERLIGRAAYVNALAVKYRLAIELAGGSRVVVARYDTPSHTLLDEDGDVADEFERYEEYIVGVRGDAASATWLPFMLLGNHMEHMADDIEVQPPDWVRISIDKANWEFVPSVLAAFLEVCC
jgi:hypothetical protein